MQESAIFRSNMQFMQKHGAEVYDSLHSAKKIAGEVVFLNGNEKPLLQYKSASINMHAPGMICSVSLKKCSGM